LQEFSFVLGKIKVEPETIINNIKIFSTATPINYTAKHFNRAIELAKQIGFKHINDCIHTAIAEEFCTELITYNKDDFNKIKNYTALKITIL
jgi:predicted nucleic acid-binding protein